VVMAAFYLSNVDFCDMITARKDIGGDAMDAILLERLSVITAEEQEILAGRSDIDRSIYMQGQGSTINSRKLLASGKLITIRPHTRFIHFPEHTQQGSYRRDPF